MALGFGGKPRVFRGTSTAQDGWVLGFPLCQHLTVTADAGAKLFFTEQDWLNGTNWLDLSASQIYDGPASCRGIWISGAANIVVIAYGQT